MSRVSFFHDILSSVFARGEPADAAPEDGSLTELCSAVVGGRGEAAERRAARGLLARFEAAPVEERLDFFELLAERYDIDAEHVERAARRYGEVSNAEHLAILMDSVEPQRQQLLRLLNQAPGATVRLVRMRECLLALVDEHPSLARIDLDFRHLFRSWFNRGFLVLREIDWSTPANVLEKIIAYEAVHAIGSWAELRARLEPPDRRCFAFFHPAMPDEPLIFVEVALTHQTPATVSEVIEPERVPLSLEDVDTAVFYSISNCQRGLAGVSFGNFLIKQVAAELAHELPRLSVFRTLSPVPGFVGWAEQRLADGQAEETERESLELAVGLARGDGERELDDAERRALATLVAGYLVHHKRPDGRPLDPVACFHLGNGASLDDVLPLADPSPGARERSAGAMVSYLYDLDSVESNHEAFAGERTVITSGRLDELALQRRTRRRA